MCTQDRGGGVDDAKREPDFEPVGAVETGAGDASGVGRRLYARGGGGGPLGGGIGRSFAERNARCVHFLRARHGEEVREEHRKGESRSARRIFLGGCRQRA